MLAQLLCNHAMAVVMKESFIDLIHGLVGSSGFVRGRVAADTAQGGLH